MTHNEMSSTVRNRVADGLSGNVADQAFSLEQLMAEIDLTFADVVYKYVQAGKLDPKFLMQEIDLIPIVCQGLANDCAIQDPSSNIPSIEVPKVMPMFQEKSIEYLGLNNMQDDFAVYYHPQDIRDHKYRIRTSHRPYAWVDLTPNSNDMINIWFFNFGKYNPLKYVKIRAIFAHPTRVNIFDPSSVDKEFPAPLHIQNTIIDNITEKYVRYYRQLNTPNIPNTQSDPIT